MRSVAMTVVGAALLTAVAGCSGLNSTEERTLSGGAIGAGTGAVIGAVSGCTACGAGIGAAVGAGAGYVYDQVED